ncbi:hypothetical protein V501_01384 [Pseudogymnoascus sp. VKM F-4519 (FW-2642)]|nr:hypothetical protein V501_01384 [Pseudogymnoascus sp. VKM F-4519 (FW-2642)]
MALAEDPVVHSILTVSDKKEHGRKRRVIGHGFTETAIRGYESMIQSQIQVFCEKLMEDGGEHGFGEESQGWSSPQNMAEWYEYLSQMTSCRDVVFSYPLDLLTRAENRFFVDVIDKMMYRVGVLSQIPQMLKWKLSPFVIPSGRLASKRFVGLAKEIATTRVQRVTADSHRDVFQNLIDAKDSETGEKLALPEVLAETMALIVAGSDTTSSALAAIFFYLSRNPEAYTKLTEEVRNTFKDASDIHSGPQLRSCTYLRACIDEGMRMNPPVSSPLWREVGNGGAKIDGEYINEGYSVATGLYALHHNPAYFSRPFRYSPERWIVSKDNSAETIELAKKAFAPFSIGARMCAARNMALLEILLTVAHVVWAMDLKVADGPVGRTGQGGLAMQRGRERDDEFQVDGHFVTVGKDGPVLQFQKRDLGT